MRFYLNRPLLIDTLLGIVIVVSIFLLVPILGKYIDYPTIESIDKVELSLITVSATLIGFLLTIVTVIITFKRSFEKKVEKSQDKKTHPSQPIINIFDRKISKEEKFYGTDIHKWTIKIFVSATIEIGIVLIMLLVVGLSEVNIPLHCTAYIVLFFLTLILLSLARCLHLFRLFIKAHL